MPTERAVEEVEEELTKTRTELRRLRLLVKTVIDDPKLAFDDAVAMLRKGIE